ncbi:aldehyde dehydrogenase [Irpex rosettiformis]|uniref:Aldehyde dehydrogenase n=1 Tax=Irpex rosettiformis TaxID=378272 RepID=A0ACB8TWK5_9APHY|nr:aldehyde dehydrogenase [Irpex rosettiformis]
MVQTWDQEFDTPLYKGKVSVKTGLFINNEWVESSGNTRIDAIDPSTGEVITTIADATASDVDTAVQAAKKAFYTTWGTKIAASERGRLLNKLADLVERDADQLAAIESRDAGKFFPHARHMDVVNVVTTMRYYAGWADKGTGETIETNETKFAYTRHEPIGVVAAIVPWNFPLMIAGWKIGPALATGNSLIIKPSEVTSLSMLYFADLVKEAGFPPGAFNVITGNGRTAGQALSEHEDIRKLSFTGSTPTGRRVLETSAKTNLKRVTLELGGKTATVVFDDADLEQAVKWSALGIFFHSGQMCTAGSRIFVHSKIYDEFVKGLTAAAQAAKGGNGFDPSCTSGPVVSEAQFERVLGYINAGKAAGATVVTGGERIGDKGYYIQPTIFANANPDSKIVREEIFGPVAVIAKFETDEEALQLANDTTFGLSTNVFTTNLNRAINFANKAESGSVYVNVASFPDVQHTFGGFKQSGFGKDLGKDALEAYTQVKAVHINIGAKA